MIRVAMGTEQNEKLKTIKYLQLRRKQLCHCSVVFGMIGIFLAIFEGETRNEKAWNSLTLKIIIMMATVLLVVCVLCYHMIETKLDAIDAGFDNWRIAITRGRVTQLLMELAICTFCPTPFTHETFIATVSFPSHHLCETNKHQPTIRLPLDAILTIPMFLRFYLIGRLIVLHSKQFQDPSTRAIAALNRVSVNFKFVIKSMIQDHPGTIVTIFTLTFWLSISWAFLQCERTIERDQSTLQYTSALWFTVVTFMTIGFGDVVPTNHCGRVLAICNRIVGMLVVSAIISVIGDNLDMSNSAQRVNAFLKSSELDFKRRNSAASIIQHLWFMFKYRELRKAPHSTLDLIKRTKLRIRFHQRKLLQAITTFQTTRQKERVLLDQGILLVDVVQVQNSMKQALLKASLSYQELAKGILVASESLLELEQMVALRGYDYKFSRSQINFQSTR